MSKNETLFVYLGAHRAAAANAEPAPSPMPSTTIPTTAVAKSHQQSIGAAAAATAAASTVGSHGERADDATPAVLPASDRTPAANCGRWAGVVVAGRAALSSNAPRCTRPAFCACSVFGFVGI